MEKKHVLFLVLLGLALVGGFFISVSSEGIITYNVSEYNVTNVTVYNVTNITNNNITQNFTAGIFTIQSTNFSLIVENGTTSNISVNTSYVQRRVSSFCASGSSIRIIDELGGVTCETDTTGGGLDYYPNVTALQLSNGTVFNLLNGISSNITYVNSSLNNLNITVQSILTSNTSIYNFLNGLWANTSALQLSNTTIFNLLNGISSNVTYVNNSVNTLNNTVIANVSNLNRMIDNINGSKSGTGSVNCASGTVMQNLTLSSGVPTVQCVTDATGSGGTSPTPPAYAYYNYWAKTEFESVTSGFVDPWVPTAIASGTSTLIAGVQNHPALANISTSTTASSGYCYQITGATTFVLQNATYTELIFRPTNSTPATQSGNQTTIRFGFQDVFTATTSPIDAVFFNITNNATGGVVNFTAHTINNSVMTVSPLMYQGSALSPSASTNWYRLYIGIVNSTQADFRIYNSTSGVLLASYLINATIPTTVGRETSHGVCGYARGVTTTARGIAELDYMSININDTLIR